MNNQINLANCVFAINSVLTISKKLSLDKVMLIYPFVYQKKMLNELSRKAKLPKSIEKLIISHPELFSNFDNVYNSNLSLAINAIQYMYEMEHISIVDGEVILLKEIKYEKRMGNNIEKYYKSAACISEILNKSSDYLYLHLRIYL
ncbi:three component ABC system middle component [Aliivibrio logei]|uniref:Uncharacterized protein n=1 Tax=Aliivibrio logei TaxID=688 RepID=A0A1B9NZM6_ALILO|nr:three component ABC system middle component [Aliivibrio logei]OCH21564.1 hypothetical protein A6E04_06765 [Aliivibrio logei]